MAGFARASERPELLTRLASFARLLHDAGLDAGPGRLKDATVALTHIDLGSEVDFRETLRTVFVTRKDELALFDAAFDIFWAPPDPRILAGAIPGRTRSLPMAPDRAKAWLQLLGLPSSEMGREQEDRTFTATSSGYSGDETLRQKNFDQMTWQETEQVRRLMAQSPWRLVERRTRRLAPARTGAIDLRRTTRDAVRSSGELMKLLHREVRIRRRPLVLLCDVSGSMERYSRQLLLFAHAIARREEVETFVFSTRLTRITRQLRRRDVDRALAGVGQSVHDFSGGTRIGDALHEFNRKWGRRVLGHGAVVILISDGWDRGDVGLLAQELARLRRMSHRLIWLNPLLGSAGYEPLTRGMAAALPHTDEFMAAHNLQALDDLGRKLASLDKRVSRS